MSVVSKRYARAAVEVAEQQGGQKGVEALASELAAFQAAVVASEQLREVIENPKLRDKREAVLQALAQKLGLQKTAQKLVLLLAQNDRTDAYGEVSAAVTALADERAGRMRAHVRSASALSEAQVSRLSRALEKRFAHPVAVGVTVEPQLLGGIVVQIGDVTLDSSIRRQLELMRERLLA
jgi:F-type H+-transporting ATPase subunit delta